jgi:phage/plasmid-like protein (TIGR03299 family)
MDRFDLIEIDGRPDVDVARNVLSHNQHLDDAQRGAIRRTEAEVTTAKALLAPAGLDWTAEEAPLLASVPVDDGNGGIALISKPVPRRKALVRSDTTEVIGDVGEAFGVVQNSTLAELADAVRNQDGDWTWAQGGALRGGSRVYMQLRSPMRNVGGEQIESNISLFNAFDGSLKFSCGFSRTVVVCRNTFAIANRDSKQGFALRHTSRVEDHVKNAIDILREAGEYFGALDNGILRMMSKPFTMAGMEQLAEVLVGDSTRREKAREALVRAYLHAPGAAEGTVWGAFQAVTNYATHGTMTRTSELRTKEEARFESSWWGAGADLTQNAWNVLQDEEKVQQLQTVRIVRN